MTNLFFKSIGLLRHLHSFPTRRSSDLTGENANMSVDALKSIVKEHDSEIRKLWDLSNKRNRSDIAANRSEEHTSELQSRPHLVCRLLLEKKNKLQFG